MCSKRRYTGGSGVGRIRLLCARVMETPTLRTKLRFRPLRPAVLWWFPPDKKDPLPSLIFEAHSSITKLSAYFHFTLSTWLYCCSTFLLSEDCVCCLNFSPYGFKCRKCRNSFLIFITDIGVEKYHGETCVFLKRRSYWVGIKKYSCYHYIFLLLNFSSIFLLSIVSPSVYTVGNVRGSLCGAR